MATKKQTIDFTAKNVKAFTNWLKRFASIDKTLLLEIDQATSTFIAKTYNEERSVVKMSSIRFDEAGLVAKPSPEPKRVKIGIYNISHLMKIMDQFNDIDFNFTIDFQDVINENVTQYAGVKLWLKSKLLKMNVDCASLNIFKYIPDDLFKNTIATMDVIGSFDLPKPTIERINTLNNLDDSEEKCMEFKMGNNKVEVSGKSYELLIGESSLTDVSGISVFKEQYSTLDIENYDVDLGDDRLIFKSKDSETVTVISAAETD